MLLEYVYRDVWLQPMQFKLDLRLARLLGIHTQTRPVIINALWQYIKTHRLQDPAEREYINCDKYLEQVIHHHHSHSDSWLPSSRFSLVFCFDSIQ